MVFFVRGSMLRVGVRLIQVMMVFFVRGLVSTAYMLMIEITFFVMAIVSTAIMLMIVMAIVLMIEIFVLVVATSKMQVVAAKGYMTTIRVARMNDVEMRCGKLLVMNLKATMIIGGLSRVDSPHSLTTVLLRLIVTYLTVLVKVVRPSQDRSIFNLPTSWFAL